MSSNKNLIKTSNKLRKPIRLFKNFVYLVNCLYYLVLKPSISNHYTFRLNDKWNDYPSFHFKTLQQEETHTMFINIHKFCYSALVWTCVFECQFRAPFKSIHNLYTHLPLKREVKVAILPNQAICYLFNLSFFSFNNYVESDVNRQTTSNTNTNNKNNNNNSFTRKSILSQV